MTNLSVIDLQIVVYVMYCAVLCRLLYVNDEQITHKIICQPMTNKSFESSYSYICADNSNKYDIDII